MNEAQEREVVAKAARAKKFLESEEWQEAWRIYRERALALIENAKSDDTDTVMQAKRLLAAATAAKTHLEVLMVNGQVALKTLEMIEKKPLLRRVMGG